MVQASPVSWRQQRIVLCHSAQQFSCNVRKHPCDVLKHFSFFLGQLSFSWRKFLGINWLNLKITGCYLKCLVCYWGFHNKIAMAKRKTQTSIVHAESCGEDNKFLSCCPSGYRTISPQMPTGQIGCVIHALLGIVQMITFLNFANNSSSCPFSGLWNHF